MNLVRRTYEIDPATDARLAEIAAERGQDVAAVLAEAVALLDTVTNLGGPDLAGSDLAGPDLAEDRRRLNSFLANSQAVPLDDARAWVASWDTPDERSRPFPRKIG
jgi:predicted transcriptional regulator